jgi:flagellar biosynthesis/type III secretory pathway protein FliH
MEELKEQKMLEEKAFQEGVEEGIEKGKIKGKLKGEIKGEISKIKDLLDFGVSPEKIIPKLKFLTRDEVKDKLESNIAYIQKHLEDSDSDICDELGLVGNLSDFSTRDL